MNHDNNSSVLQQQQQQQQQQAQLCFCSGTTAPVALPLRRAPTEPATCALVPEHIPQI